MCTVTGKERKSENLKRKKITGIQGEFQRTDTLETKENNKLEETQSKTVCVKSVMKRMNWKEMRLHFS